MTAFYYELLEGIIMQEKTAKPKKLLVMGIVVVLITALFATGIPSIAFNEATEGTPLQNSVVAQAFDEQTAEAANGYWYVNGHGKWMYWDTLMGNLRGWQKLSWSGGTHWFYFNGAGEMQTGLQYLSWNGEWDYYYFHPSDGYMYSNVLVWGLGAKEWFFDASGAGTYDPWWW
jgi:hypothetical protein